MSSFYSFCSSLFTQKSNNDEPTNTTVTHIPPITNLKKAMNNSIDLNETFSDNNKNKFDMSTDKITNRSMDNHNMKNHKKIVSFRDITTINIESYKKFIKRNQNNRIKKDSYYYTNLILVDMEEEKVADSMCKYCKCDIF